MHQNQEKDEGYKDNFCDPMALMRWSSIYSRAVSVEWYLQYRD